MNAWICFQILKAFYKEYKSLEPKGYEQMRDASFQGFDGVVAAEMGLGGKGRFPNTVQTNLGMMNSYMGPYKKLRTTL